MDRSSRSKDADINRLMIDNRKLVDELRQCQADKEFVWSLWKRLQVSSPDLTQAISTVMEREREKNEVKDRKVLEMLQNKDEEIKNLHEVVATLKQDKDDLFKAKMALEVDQDTKSVSMDNFEKEIYRLKQLIEKNQTDYQEKSQSYERSIKELETQREDLKVKIAGFLTDLQEMRSKMQTLEDENQNFTDRNHSLRDQLSDKEEILRKVKEEKESVVSELERVLRDYSQIKTGVCDDLKSRDKRYKDLKSAYEDLTDQNQQQLVLIKQLQDLQSSTKKVLSEQEEAHRNEKKSLQLVNSDLLDANENLKEKRENLLKENDSLRRRVEVQERTLKESEEELKSAIAMATESDRGYYYRDFHGLEEKISSQRREIADLQRKLKANRERDRHSPSPQYNRMVDHTFSPIIERGHGRQHARSRSLSPCTQSRQLNLLQKKLKATETKLDDTKQLLELKKDEVREIQRAHDKRLDRLKMLQSDFRSLKSGRNDDLSPRKKSNKNRYHRSDPKELRQENSETVWNELARYKHDNKALSREKLSLEEEVDALRVQASMDRATIHDLNLCLKQEKNELASRIRMKHHDEERLCSTPKSGKSSSRSVKNLERKLENAAEDIKILKKDKKRLIEDSKILKDDIKSLKMEVTDARQNSSKLRLENNQLRHKAERFKSESSQIDGDISSLRSELDNMRDENSTLRIENHSLRDENRDLRQDVADLKLEIVDLNAELKDLEQSTGDSTDVKSKNSWKSNSAKQHQKFLNKSVQELQAAFRDRANSDGGPTSTGDDTLPDEVGRSDASSLGQSIVKACRRRNASRKAVEDEDDTLVEDSVDTQRSLRPSARRPSSLPRHGSGGIVPSLKQRISSLQTQCSSLRTAKQAAVKKVTEQKERNVQLESELTTCQNKIKNFKQSMQRLNREIEMLQGERDDLQRALTEANNKKPEPQQHSDADYKFLESKLKIVNSDMSRMSEQLKDAKRDLERKMDQLTTEKEKVSRLERDVSMKRQLIDEIRVKSKENESKLKEEYNAKLDVEERIKVIEEELSHKKNHIESMRRQLQACTKEKSKYEMMYNKSREEIDKRCEQLSSAQASKLDAENATSRMEQEAEQQLQTLASRSEQALEKLSNKLSRSEERLSEFTVFVQNLSSHLIQLLFQQEENLSHEKAIVSDSQNRHDDDDDHLKSSSMSHAQKVACDILNMSRSDFEDLMAPVNSGKNKTEFKDSEHFSAHVPSQYETWRLRVEKIATENPPFAKSLSRLVWDKIQDVVRITEEKSRVRIEHLEEELMSRRKF